MLLAACLAACSKTDQKPAKVGNAPQKLTTLDVPPPTPDPKFHLYVLMGQSNMSGRGDSIAFYNNLSSLYSKVLMFKQDSTWVMAKHPLHFDKPQAAVGPGLDFANKMLLHETDPDVRIGVIPCAVGGSSILDWGIGEQDYTDAKARIIAAMKYGVVKGMLWQQGEADSGYPDGTPLANYNVKLYNLITHVRNVTGNPNLPATVGQLGRFNPKFTAFNQNLNKITDPSDPDYIAHTAIVLTVHLTHKGSTYPDNIHFNSFSAKVLGERHANAMIANP